MDEVFFENFLKRYIAYKVFNIEKRLNLNSWSYYNKAYTTELIEEEIFISIIRFPRKYDLEDKPSDSED